MLPDRTAEVVKELVVALRELAPHHRAVTVGTAWLSQHREQALDLLPGWVKKKRCYTCNAEIFFACHSSVHKNNDTVWVPMVPVSITSDHVILDAVSVRFSNKDAIIDSPEPGVQWFPHRVLCGLTAPPADEDMAKLWHLTVGLAIQEEEQAVESLLKTLGETE